MLSALTVTLPLLFAVGCQVSNIGESIVHTYKGQRYSVSEPYMISSFDFQ